jgi:hypothetical protein
MQAELAVTVGTDEPYYQSSGLVTIFGIVKNSTNNPIVNAMVGIQVQDPDNNTIFLDIASSSSTGDYHDSFRLHPTSITGNYKVYATASATGYPTAANQTTFTVAHALLGDINFDGTVNILDAIDLSNSFGKSTGQTGFNPNADFDDNGAINILDAITLANNYNQHYP